jgi:hypothetical protein
MGWVTLQLAILLVPFLLAVQFAGACIYKYGTSPDSLVCRHVTIKRM